MRCTDVYGIIKETFLWKYLKKIGKDDRRYYLSHWNIKDTDKESLRLDSISVP